MKSLVSTVILAILTLTLNAQVISFNALKEAALGNEDVLKRELIENGWTMEKMDDDNSYGYAHKNLINVTTAFVIFFDSYISCRSIEHLEDSVYDDLYAEIKSNCKYNGVETFISQPIDYISYSHKSGVDFRVYSEEGIYSIDAGGSSSD
jgi:hypothetical protein